jgi:exodeoxyribonuclease VII small subunit
MEELKEKSFEEALKELEAIVKQFEEGKFTLDQAVVAYERGMLLKQHCADKLQHAKTKIEKVVTEK